MIRAVSDLGQDVIVEKSGKPEVVMISFEDYEEFRRAHPKPAPSWAERMMQVHRKIAEKWVGPGLTAEEVDEMIDFGQR